MAEYGLTTAVKLSSNEMPDQALPAVAAVLGEAYARMQRMNRALMAAGLVDRVQVTLFPVITGQTGVDPIFQDAADFDLELIESRTLDGHTQELIYRPTLHG
ncbi:dihydrofolate reductase family protein [Actinomadura sp. 6K520]|uniref:dihydrofolate reductase family protein n=1 Tax=Actinomadura sp. 6K520 TaxID=2530364 RepID=UPI001FB83345|nr:dihydrofolate reductase family protein [Actinomadura sp. 6K520]